MTTMTATSPLIDPTGLRALGRTPMMPLVFDCRFDLARPSSGEEAYSQGHIPGALYLHLERHLSAMPPAPALCGGRHPLPPREVFAATMAAQGLRPGRPVVVYDAAQGMYAARAWWMLRWIGHEQVQVLDGGWAAWLASGGATEAGVLAPTPAAATYPLPDRPTMQTIGVSELLAQLDQVTVIDARAPERYRGETEPLDPVAGHIPGALNHPFSTNLQPDGRFLDSATLRARFDALLGSMPSRAVVQQCGSGVTACHNLLAMAVAGRGDSCLYPGSWSEWCSDPTRPVARG